MFFAFEGPEGSGKTTLRNKVAEHLFQDFDVLMVNEPGGTWWGDQVKSMCMSDCWLDYDGITQASFIYGARRAQWLDNVLPHLQRGGIVLADRWHLSTYVYQSLLAGVPLAAISGLESTILPEKSFPDTIFLLLADANDLTQRIESMSEKKIMTRSPFNRKDTKVRNRIVSAYQHLAANMSTVVSLNALDTSADLARVVIANIRAKLAESDGNDRT